jgi:SAM-dependent methyltransferase
MWNSDREAFAAREPHFSVLTAPRFLKANLTPEHEREFFASGEAVVSWMLDVIDAGLVPEFAPMTVLEYGCGIGRLAFPLARRPGAVTAVDSSPAMLDRARQEAARRELQHIAFETPEQLFASRRRFDLVVCYHVLQRMPRAGAIRLVRQLSDLIAPGGVGVFQWPYRSADTRPVRASRWVRERVPGANAVVNAMRGKAAGVPFIPTHVYPIPAMLRAFDSPVFRSTHVALQRHEGLDYAILFAEKRESAGRSARERRPAREGGAPAATEVVSDAEIDAFNRAADAYFGSLADWDHHLAKPFSQAEETPVLLANLAVVLQALRLTPGMRVLEFGAGSGWLSRFLTQMGCRVVVLDVSETALRMARELYARQPVIGTQPAPEFLLFDGRRIDLPDGSLDRILCFDAFHHAPNPRATIAEFGRLLADGGIAAFAEPGPRHAGAPRSRFESQTYGVVERDVDVHDIWRAACAAGFRDLRMNVFHGPPYEVTLEDYEQLLAGGPVQEEWLASTRKFLRHVRFFSLVKGGVPRADSRSPAGLACDIRAGLPSGAILEGQPIELDVVVTNAGANTWLPSDEPRGGVALGSHLYDPSGTLIAFDFHVEPLATPPRDIAPGETVRLRFSLPSLPAGAHRVELDCVAAHVTWFAQAGSRPAVLDLVVGSRTR